jgi:glycosyltransferase involved in cell wall biosynthesis
MEQVTSTRNSNPLVSIIVITYNSAKYVLETLESAKVQTYQNIELIISDDASQDDTVHICKGWLDKNMGRFVRTELVTIEQNSGTPANCNRGVKAAKGEWVKLIAGDDVLDRNYLFYSLKFISNLKINLIAGAIYVFEKNLDDKEFYWPKFNFPQSLNKQKRMQLIDGLLLAPSVMIRKNELVNVGGFDERFTILEDDPMWIKLFEKNNKCYYTSSSIVYYRQHLESANSLKTRTSYYRNPMFLRDSIKFGFKIKLPLLRKKKYYRLYLLFFVIKIAEYLIYLNGSRIDNSPFNALLNRIIGRLNSFYYRFSKNINLQ